jgi:hypothetical protein
MELMRGPVRVVVVVLALAACGEKAPPARASHEGRKPDVTLEVFFGTREKPRFDPRAPDPRVRKAYAQLTELVGHAVAFQFDEALVPKWTSDFDTLFARCIETVAADLAAL